MRTLSKQQVLAMHGQLIAETGGQPGLRDESLLESALAAPFASFGNEELYPTLSQKAARLGYGLVKNHAFIDGNKRIAAHATLVFLAINGVELQYTQRELSDMFLRLASGEADGEDLLAWITKREA